MTSTAHTPHAHQPAGIARAADPPVPARRLRAAARRTLAVARPVVVLAVLAVIGTQLWRMHEQIGADLGRLPIWVLVVAVLVVMAGEVPGMLSWRTVVAGMGTELSPRVATRMFFLGGLTKYLPGGVWPALVHADMARAEDEAPAKVALAFPVSVAVSSAAGIAAGIFAFHSHELMPPGVPGGVWLGVLGLAAIGVLTAPLMFRPVLGAASRRLRRLARSVDLGSLERGRVLRAVLLALTGWVVSALHVSVLAYFLGAGSLQALATVPAYCLAAVAGMISVLLPAGLGAKEAVLGAALIGALPASQVIALLAISRIVVTAADVLAGLLVYTLVRRYRRPGTPAPAA